jgi:acyl-CoA reductase-like NAD-dependent aldehyde dehydrogenase
LEAITMSDQELPTHQLYINGQWRAPRQEQYDPTYDPATGQVLAHVAKANAEDTRDAIHAARTAFDSGPWPQMSPGERSRLLHQIVDALEARQGEIADLEWRTAAAPGAKPISWIFPAVALPSLR